MNDVLTKARGISGDIPPFHPLAASFRTICWNHSLPSDPLLIQLTWLDPLLAFDPCFLAVLTSILHAQCVHWYHHPPLACCSAKKQYMMNTKQPCCDASVSIFASLPCRSHQGLWALWRGTKVGGGL
ncbi:hypothetical protein BaRGS_00013336 [Batillaria attramentaria]|uniref:Uncharacterized protein n=1 Tax=Batillaria attramentaria TaxID=370345 RepID=A0ABD0L7R3_9CAEN